jgi:hypothetical protein
MNTYNKKELLKALRTILKEYRNETHERKKNKCALCLLYIYNEYECDKCPMFVFDNSLFDDTEEFTYPCMNRKCTPVDCSDAPFAEEETKRVKEFYKATINKVVSMTTKELNAKRAFKFLVDIDNKISIKYDN